MDFKNVNVGAVKDFTDEEIRNAIANRRNAIACCAQNIAEAWAAVERDTKRMEWCETVLRWLEAEAQKRGL